jgi:hypothetical protein
LLAQILLTDTLAPTKVTMTPETATLENAIAALAKVSVTDAPTSQLVTSDWWAARMLLLRQRLLAKRAPTLRGQLLLLHAKMLNMVGGGGCMEVLGAKLATQVGKEYRL